MDLSQRASALGEDDASPTQKPKGVKFHNMGSIEEVQRISRYSMYDAEEVEAYWGNSDEQRLRKKELKEAVVDWQMGRQNSDNFSFTTVGIEDKVGEGRALKKEMRWRSRNAVLDEQELQEAEGNRDDELLADIYGSTTKDAQVKAQQDASRIATEVGRFQDSFLKNVEL